jgi:phosphate transport system substrate-binding protein
MKLQILLAKVSVVFLISASALAQNDELHGAGSTFAAGAYTSWAFSYSKEKGIPIAYRPTGSGDGIKQIVARNVDFGASDYALSPEELKKNGLIQIPTLVGGVVPVLNVPGLRAGQLRLTGTVLAAIFSGRITRWNDRDIQALNGELKLPALPIICIVRSEASGTTAGFTEYLSKIDNDWATRVGTGLQVTWSKDFKSVKGNDAVAKVVNETSGAIGYVSANIVGYIEMPGADAWPITDATYILLERNPKNPARATSMLRFIYWSFLRGDAMASETGYVPLPVTVQARAVGSLQQIHGPQDTPLDFMGNYLKGGGALKQDLGALGLLAAL